MRSRLVTFALSLSVALAAGGGAQRQPRIPVSGEYRVDAIVGTSTAVHLGGGVNVPAGVYTRVSIIGAAGARWTGGSARTSGRVDVLARFLLDPFRESPVGFSLGGGLTLPVDAGARVTRPYLTAVMDLEGRQIGRFTPAVQLGLGGGTRLGVVVRSSPRNWR